MTGCYTVYSFPQGADHPDDIAFQINGGMVGDVPGEQAALKSEIEKTLDVLRGMYQSSDSKFKSCHRELVATAQYGLVGDSAQPSEASNTLKNIQRRIFDREKGRIISQHMNAIIRAYALTLGTLCLLAAVSAIVLWYFGWVDLALLSSMAISAFLGLFAGALFSSFLRCRTVGFYDLAAIDADRFTPGMRCAFSVVILLIAAAFLKSGVFEILIGTVKLSDFDKSYLAAFVFGCAIGIAQEPAISRIEGIKSKVAPSPDKSTP